MAEDHLRDVLPHVRMWYGTASQGTWSDEGGVCYVVQQGEGGEQGDALMPALFFLAPRPALRSIQSRLRKRAVAVAYFGDIHFLTSPGRVREAHDIAVMMLWETCGTNANKGTLAC